MFNRVGQGRTDGPAKRAGMPGLVKARPGMDKAARTASAFIVLGACAYCFSRTRKRLSNSGYSVAAGRDEGCPELAPAQEGDGPAPAALSLSAELSESSETPAEPATPAFVTHNLLTPIPVSHGRSRAFLYSILLHSIFVWLLGLGLDIVSEMPSVEPVRGYSFRVLQLTLTPDRRLLDPAPQTAVKRRVGAAAKRQQGAAIVTKGRTPDATPMEAADGSEGRRFQLPPDLTIRKGEHTLVQPDVTDRALRTESVRVPDALVWSQPDTLKKSVIVPAPEPGAKSPDDPLGLELPLRDVKILERHRPVPTPAAEPQIFPVATRVAPVQMRIPDKGNQIPEALSRITSEKSAGHLISMADIPLPQEALIAIPPINQIAALRSAALPPAGNGPAGNSGNTSGINGGEERVGIPKSVPDVPMSTATAAPATPAPPKSAGNETGGVGLAGDRSIGSDLGGPGTSQRAVTGDTTRIDHPPDGKPSTMVLGSSTTESYPESAGVLACKIYYTVYVDVGLPKNWILQFCLPTAAERTTTGSRGIVTALDAPWPFVMMRPPIAALSGDYTLVRGLVNARGRFEKLSLVVPDDGAKKELLGALQQWEFRSAVRDGQPIAVEILLIIPHKKD